MYLDQTLFLAAALSTFFVTRGVIFLKPSPHFQSFVWIVLILLPILTISAALAFSSIRIWSQADSFSYWLTWSAGSPEAVSTLFGCLFGIMLAILVDLAQSGDQYFRWGLATAIVLLVGGFYVDVKQGIGRLTSLESPLISFQLRQDDTETTDYRIVDPKQGVMSFSRLVPFQTGVENFSRTAPLLDRDYKLVTLLTSDDSAVAHFDDIRGALSYFDAAACLQKHAKAFPEGVPLEEPLVNLGTNLLGVENDNGGDSKYFQIVSDTLTEIFERTSCMQKIPPMNESVLKTGTSELPYISIASAHVMVAAGYPRSGAAVLLHWLDQHPANESMVRLLTRIRALTELLLILKTDRDHRGATLVLVELVKTYREFVPAAFDVNLEEAIPRQGKCASVQQNASIDSEAVLYFKSFVFGAISAYRELVEFEAKYHTNRVAISNGELNSLADKIHGVEISCFRSLFGDDSDVTKFRVHFLLSYAYAKLALVGAKDIVIDEDRADVKEFLRHARAALEEALNALSLLDSPSSEDSGASLSARVLNQSGRGQLLDEVTNLRNVVISLQRRA